MMTGVQIQKNSYFWNSLVSKLTPYVDSCISYLIERDSSKIVSSSNTSIYSLLDKLIKQEDLSLFSIYPAEEIRHELLVRLAELPVTRLEKYPLWCVVTECKDWARRELFLARPVELAYTQPCPISTTDYPVRLSNWDSYLNYLRSSEDLKSISNRTYQGIDTVCNQLRRIRDNGKTH